MGDGRMKRKFPDNKKSIEIVVKGWPPTGNNTTIKVKGKKLEGINFFKLDVEAGNLCYYEYGFKKQPGISLLRRMRWWFFRKLPRKIRFWYYNRRFRIEEV